MQILSQAANTIELPDTWEHKLTTANLLTAACLQQTLQASGDCAEAVASRIAQLARCPSTLGCLSAHHFGQTEQNHQEHRSLQELRLRISSGRQALLGLRGWELKGLYWMLLYQKGQQLPVCLGRQSCDQPPSALTCQTKHFPVQGL